MSPAAVPNSLRGFRSQVLRSTLPALAVYFGLRAFGAPAYIALGATAVFAVSHLVFEMARGRGADPLLLVLIAFAATGAIVSFATRDPRYAQLSSLPPGALVSVYALASAFTRRPATLSVTEKYWPDCSIPALRGQGWAQRDIDGYVRAHASTSLICGLIEMAQVGFALAVILTCQVDIAQLFLETSGPATTVCIVVLAVRRIRGSLRAPAGAVSAEALLPQSYPA